MKTTIRTIIACPRTRIPTSRKYFMLRFRFPAP